MKCFVRAFVFLLVMSSAIHVSEAAFVTFYVDMSVQIGYGCFDPASDTVVVRGSFNNWSGNQDSLSDSDSDFIYERTIELQAGNYPYKFVMILADGSVIWENSISDRSVIVDEDDILLDTVYFDDDETVPIAPQDVEVRFMVNMEFMIDKSMFEPDSDWVVVRGSHAALGNWADTGAVLSREGTTSLYSVWVRFEQLSNYPIYYKFVVLRNSDLEDSQWEDGDNRSFTIIGDEPDNIPPPIGNGYAEFFTNLVYFNHEEGWEPADVRAGADLSIVPQMEYVGAEYRVDGVPGNVLDIFHEREFEIVRFRLWHTPADPWHDLDSTIAFAKRAYAAGFDLMLDFHYSDSWADPGQQTKPAAWETLDFATLVDSMYAYTNNVILRFRDEGILPKYVQVGNEIAGGMLWDDGCVGWPGSEWDTPQQWTQFTDLLKAGIAALRDSLPVEEQPKIILHLHCGGDNSRCQYFFDNMIAYSVDYDIIGLSYYPWWHGTFYDLEANLQDLAPRYSKEIQVVETSYPWTLEPYDGVNNVVWQTEQLLPGYPATPEGQKDFVEALLAIVQETPDGLGTALLWWEPAFQSVGGYEGPMENLTLFDFDGDALPALGLLMSEPLENPVATLYTSGSSEVTLRWDSIPGAQSYRIERATSLDGPWMTIGVATSPEFTDYTSMPRAYYRVVVISSE